MHWINKSGASRPPRGWLALLCLVLMPADAIVIRHDTGYTRYIASEADYPGVFPLSRQGQRTVCVATLIAPQWALTAAHCVAETPILAALADGAVYPVEIGRQTHAIDAVHQHPGWSGGANAQLLPQQTDLALLHLAKPASASAVMELYRGDQELAQTMTFLGWGFTGIGTTGTAVSDGRLRFAHNTVVSADERLRFHFDDPRDKAALALEFEGIPGLGDSGGPALIRANDTLQLAGIAVGELANDAGSAGRYGAVVVYERVSRHLHWIESLVSREMPDAESGDLTGN